MNAKILDEDAIVEEIIQQERQMVKLQKKERVKFERFAGKQHNCVLAVLFALLIIAAMSVVVTLHGNKLNTVDLMDIGSLLHSVQKTQGIVLAEQQSFTERTVSLENKFAAVLKAQMSASKCQKRRNLAIDPSAVTIDFDCSNKDTFFPIPSNTKWMKTNYGFEMLIYKDGDHTSHLINEQRKPISTFHQKGKTVVDVSSNMCFNALVWASQGLNVEVFEALEWNKNMCVHSICKNKYQEKITLHQAALSDSTRPCKVFSETNEVSKGVVSCNGNNPKNHHLRNIVSSIRLDEAMECPEGNISMLNLETEDIFSVMEGSTYLMGCVESVRASVDNESDFYQLKHMFPHVCYASDRCETPITGAKLGETLLFFKENVRKSVEL